MQVTLFTSGSTKEPKQVNHSNIDKYVNNAINEIELSSKDIVLDVFPANVIAHYTVTAQPALKAGAHLITAQFDPYNYINLFNEYRPTYIALIPRHIDILMKTKGWDKLDMSCVRYMVTGSQKIKQSYIDHMLAKGVKLVANWYGMTEMPPPVFIGYNSESFNFKAKLDYQISFDSQGQCYINSWATGDIFDLSTKTFSHRISNPVGNTWKTL